MSIQCTTPTNSCPAAHTAALPAAQAAALAAAQAAFDEVVEYCETCASRFSVFERELMIRVATLARCLICIFLEARHQHLDLRPFLQDGRYRLGADLVERTLKTAYGVVRYGRRYLSARGGGVGIAPLDVVLGLTRDRLSPWVMQWVARLATRLSYQAARTVCKAALGWAPATETIEQVVLGMGREAAPFMRDLKPPAEDGEVLVIEIDGKCAPTATATELAKRRGKRKPKTPGKCRCQRHRGRAKREARGSKKRRKRGDKSKHGKEVTVVVMYTLKRGEGGQLHGPVNKKLYATFAGRKAGALWARAEATKRGFGPKTKKTIQIVLDGAKSLRANLKSLFPKAIFTLDVCHVVERLWTLGRHYYEDGSDALKGWVEKLKEMVYEGRAETLVAWLRELLAQVPERGPGTKGRRQVLKRLIGYLVPRREMMRYGEWMRQDLVIASGQVEGAVRYVVGERLDCSGMRWVRGKAEAVLHLRCIELNGDWDEFANWFEQRVQAQVAKNGSHKILTDQALPVLKAA